MRFLISIDKQFSCFDSIHVRKIEGRSKYEFVTFAWLTF